MSILRQVKDLERASSTLVLGEPAHGKSHTVIRDLAEYKDKRVLWISFANLNGLLASHCKDWDVAQPTTWEEMKSQILSPIISGEWKYEAIVIDGLNVCAGMCLSYISLKNSEELNAQIDDPITIKQNYWLVMGRTMQNMITLLRTKTPSLYVTVDVLPDADGVKQVDLNRDLFGRIVGQFEHKWLAYALPKKKDKKEYISYHIETNGARAIRLRPVFYDGKGGKG